MGPPGSGKTTSLVTLLEAGLEVFVIFTEANGLDSMIDAINFIPGTWPRKVRPDAAELMKRFHYHVLPPPSAGMSAIRQAAIQVGTMSFKDLKTVRPDRSPDTMIALIDAVNAFTDQRTGVIYEDVALWDDSRALVIDGLSGINEIVRKLTVGHKPSPDQGEWGVMMGQEHDFIYNLIHETKCYFVLLAHINRSVDDITQMKQITPAAITYSNSAKLGKDFSEVILAKREKDKFLWSTSESQTDIKNRALPISDSIPPDFRLLVDAHRARVASLTVT